MQGLCGSRGGVWARDENVVHAAFGEGGAEGKKGDSGEQKKEEEDLQKAFEQREAHRRKRNVMGEGRSCKGEVRIDEPWGKGERPNSRAFRTQWPSGCHEPATDWNRGWSGDMMMRLNNECREIRRRRR